MCAFGRVSYTCNGDEEEEADRLNMLDVRSLYVTYLSEEERVEAVRGIDFSAEEGKVTGIVGESGSGKSTAMLAVMGLLDHKAAVEAEKVSLFGNTVRAGDNAAIIFQDPLKCLNPTVKIGRQIAETVRNRKKCTWREAKKRSEELLDSVGIRHPRLRMKQYPFELSGGMRQRVVNCDCPCLRTESDRGRRTYDGA